MPNLKINTNDYQIKNIKLAVNQDDIKSLIFASGSTEIDISNDYSSCELEQGLHFLLWGYYGSINYDQGEYLEVKDANDTFIKITPGWKTSKGNEKGDDIPFDFLKNEFCYIDDTYFLYKDSSGVTYYTNKYTDSGSEIIASFFETKNNIILNNNLTFKDTSINNKGQILIDHIFYPEYEIKDWKQSTIAASKSGQHKLYDQIDINVVANIQNNSWTTTIPKHDTYKYCDVFVTLFNNPNSDNDQTDNYLEINGAKENLPFAFFNDSFSFYYKLGLDATIDNTLKFFAGSNYYSVYKLKIIYYLKKGSTLQSIFYKPPFVAPKASVSCKNDTTWFTTSKGYDLGITKCIYDFHSFTCDNSKVQSIIESDLQSQGIFDTNKYEYKEADWADLNLTVDEQKAMLKTFGINTSVTADTSIGWCTYKGNECYSSDRHYFASFHNYVTPGYYLVHAYYNKHYIDLGSWHTTMKFLIKRTSKK